jgi:hypothetical protein
VATPTSASGNSKFWPVVGRLAAMATALAFEPASGRPPDLSQVLSSLIATNLLLLTLLTHALMTPLQTPSPRQTRPRRTISTFDAITPSKSSDTRASLHANRAHNTQTNSCTIKTVDALTTTVATAAVGLSEALDARPTHSMQTNSSGPDHDCMFKTGVSLATSDVDDTTNKQTNSRVGKLAAPTAPLVAPLLDSADSVPYCTIKTVDSLATTLATTAVDFAEAPAAIHPHSMQTNSSADKPLAPSGSPVAQRLHLADQDTDFTTKTADKCYKNINSGEPSPLVPSALPCAPCMHARTDLDCAAGTKNNEHNNIDENEFAVPLTLSEALTLLIPQECLSPMYGGSERALRPRNRGYRIPPALCTKHGSKFCRTCRTCRAACDTNSDNVIWS